ncbi:hypothetical protein G9463_10250 [Haloarcula sp. JP-Z28]|uniref:hypothetical protein n=1 Tax=unclassified Haloarcula TaxID=2624677 RepID=UPI001313DBA7|nr:MULTISPECIES: hypothetical protein [unclassified Haloarcula]NHN63675.1 hypothetical protein [Haloarcula sp. JP-Z28]
MADANGLGYEHVHGSERKIKFEPWSNGKFKRIKAVCDGYQWWVTEREVVTTMRRT